MKPFEFTLSRTAKNAIQTALAMTISYGIALGMGWERPNWAGFAVIVLSAAPLVGASIKKAILRMLGTMVAVVFSLLFIALFSQDRWLFMLTLSIYIGICTYMMAGEKNSYFWFVAGFVCVVICIDAGPDSANAFSIAMMRAEETGLGILVYSIITLFLWPNSALTGFSSTAESIAVKQHLLYRASMDFTAEETERTSLKGETLGALTQFPSLLDAAASESYDVRRHERHWQQYLHNMNELREVLGRWNDSADRLDLKNLIPVVSNFTEFDEEIERRLLLIQAMLRGEHPESLPARIDLNYDSKKVDTLSHFNRAELCIVKYRLARLDTLTLALFESVSVIKGFMEDTLVINEKPERVSLDIERLKAALRVMASMWIAFVAVIYIRDFPAGFGIVSMAASLGMNVATVPVMRAAMMLKPVLMGLLIGSFIYIFIMPHLSTFIGLGLVLFIATFYFCYFYSAPQQALSKMFGLIMLVTVTAISNVQTYSFVGVTSTVLMLLLVLLVLYITESIPFTTRPEKVCVKLLRRFFRASEYVMTTLNNSRGGHNTWWSRCKTGFFEYELATLPGKIKQRSSALHVPYLEGDNPANLELFNISLQSLAFNIRGLYEAHRSPDVQADMLYFHSEMRDWVNHLLGALEALSKKPVTLSERGSQKQLAQMMAELDTRINMMLDDAGQYSSDDKRGQYLYPLLAAHQGLSYAIAGYVHVVSSVDWPVLLEEKFA